MNPALEYPLYAGVAVGIDQLSVSVYKMNPEKDWNNSLLGPNSGSTQNSYRKNGKAPNGILLKKFMKDIPGCFEEESHPFQLNLSEFLENKVLDRL